MALLRAAPTLPHQAPPPFGSSLLSRPSLLPLMPKPYYITPKTPSLTSQSLFIIIRRRPFWCFASSSDSVDHKNSPALREWDWMTAKLTAAANVPILLRQLPQITLNARNLMAGNRSALFAVSWLGMLTGLLANLSLMSYYAQKREIEAALLQTSSVLSAYIVIAQLATAEAMPLPHFIVTSVVVATGLVLNFLNYFNRLSNGSWQFWKDFITIGGLSVLPQVVWSTFIPFVPSTLLPGLVSCVAATAAVVMARTGKLSEKGVQFVSILSGWSATLLFMWMPIAQMWTNHLNPDNIKGVSAITVLLSMIGNGLVIPRAIFVRDFMWFTGATWTSFLHGWGNLLCMYCFKSITREFFFTATFTLYFWLGLSLWKDSKVYGYSSPLRSLKELVCGLSQSIAAE